MYFISIYVDILQQATYYGCEKYSTEYIWHITSFTEASMQFHLPNKNIYLGHKTFTFNIIDLHKT